MTNGRNDSFMKKWSCLLAVALFIVFSAIPASAQEKIRCAVAANFIQAFQDLASVFERKEGVQSEPTFSSSGNLYTQIINGAPYDVFLSADEDRPKRLHDAGLGGVPFVYARGRVILWSANRGFCRAGDWKAALRAKDVKRLAIANPELAPYGMSARKTLEREGLWDLVKDKLVNAQDIAQSFQYATTGAVEARF